MRDWRTEAGDADVGDHPTVRVAPGKRSLTAHLQPRMDRARDPAEASPGELPALDGGTPLGAPTRASMEQAFATDLSAVRVHEHTWVATRGADAVTHGDDIVFAPGRYAPDQHAGRELLAHELTHVVQQRQGRTQVSQASRASSALFVDELLEREADEVGARVAGGAAAGLVAPGGTTRVAARAAAQPRMVQDHDGGWRHVPDDGRDGPPYSFRRVGPDRYLAPTGVPYRYVADTDELVIDIEHADLDGLQAAMESDALTPDEWTRVAARLRTFPAVGQRRELQRRFAQQLEGDGGTAAVARRKRARPARDVAAASLYADVEDPSQSELSEEEEYRIDRRRERESANQRLTFVPVANRGHIPGVDEVADGAERGYEHLTGLGYASTFGGVLHDGSLVPRAVDAHLNVHGHRQPPPEAALRALADRRATALAGGTDDEVARRQLQMGFNSLFFPSGAELRDEERDDAAVRRQDEMIGRLRGDAAAPDAVRALASRGAPPGLRTVRRDETHTDSEQLILASHLWQSLVGRLLAMAHGDGGMGDADTHTLQLVLNRSSCRGCGRVMMAELISFWERLGAGLDPPLSWQAAKERFAARFRFLVSFPAMYQHAQEQKLDFRNFDEICAGLFAAGWQIQVERGFGAGGEDSSRSAQERAARLGGGAPPAEARDAPPPSLTAAAAAAAPRDFAPTAAQERVLGERGLALVWVENDGRCLVNALRANGIDRTPAQLLNLAADHLPADAPPGEAERLRRGDWAGFGGDMAPLALAEALDLTIHVIQPDGNILQIGSGARSITVVRVTSPLEHYHATRRA